MSSVVTKPGGQSPDVYKETLRGHYGEFTSDTSFPLSYIQTVVRMEDIDLLKTATEAFSTSSLDFEELIQRDIDQVRVKSIVDDYLKLGKDRVLFFPPLLVSLVAVDSNQLIPDYESIEHEVHGEDIYTTWGGDRFQIIMPTSKDATGYKYKTDKGELNSNPYWSVLRINTNKIALVVIDGQHRLSALKYLWNNADSKNKKIVEKINIPISIIFSPDAISGNENHETVNRDLRELFVRINSTAKQVSGHFITLLNDNSLSSLVIRSLCEKSKNESVGNEYTLLNMIEWNQRETKVASQLNRKYSITTIKILADTLNDYAFDEKTGGLTSTLLNLSEYKSELEENNGILIDEISESNFSTSQVDLLQEIISEKITSAIYLLLFNSRPYLLCVENFKKAGANLDGSISKDVEGTDYFKQKVLLQYRDWNEFDPVEARTAQTNFISTYASNSNEIDGVYFLNVFQQGYLRVWLKLSNMLSTEGVSPEKVAEIIVDACESVCFSNSVNLFNSERIYLQKLLFNGARVIVSKKSKDNWVRLIFASMLNKDSNKRIVKTLKDEVGDKANEIAEKINELCSDALKKYLENLKASYVNDYTKNWSDKDFPAQTMKELEMLSEKIKQEDKEAKELFDSKMIQYAEKRLEEATSKLHSALKI